MCWRTSKRLSPRLRTSFGTGKWMDSLEDYNSYHLPITSNSISHVEYGNGPSTIYWNITNTAAEANATIFHDTGSADESSLLLSLTESLLSLLDWASAWKTTTVS